ncbi:MAG: HIT domain-containing protein [Verrucomicrobiota bacterium]
MAHESLHAYWRMPYIKEPVVKGGERKNPFLKVLEANDPKSVLLVYRSSMSFIVMNKFPYNAGHLLCLPNREVADIEDLGPDESADLWNTILKAKKLLRLTLAPNAFNIGFNIGDSAGAGIPSHLHCHVVPRWSGDTNFMPVVSNTRVLPEAMDTLWERLQEFVPEIED